MAAGDSPGVLTASRASGSERLGVALIFEQHLGHRTFGENLRAAAAADPLIDVSWIPVTYEHASGRIGERLAERMGIAGTLAGRREVRAGLLEHDADVWVYNTQVPAALAGRRLRAPYVVITDVTPRQFDRMAAGYQHRADRVGPTAAWKHWRNRRVFAGAARCVGWSTWVATSLERDYGVDPARIEVIPPGVDVARWTPGSGSPDDRCRILFVGGEFARKGGDLLLEAFEGLPPDTELYLVTKSNVPGSDRVHVINDLQPNDPRLIELYRTADVFVIPSRAETFGIAAVEASASGLPVVASDIGGFRDIVVDGVTGYIVPPGDGAALARSLEALVGDPDRRRRFGAAARAHAECHFDAQANARRLFALAREAADA